MKTREIIPSGSRRNLAHAWRESEIETTLVRFLKRFNGRGFLQIYYFYVLLQQ